MPADDNTLSVVQEGDERIEPEKVLVDEKLLFDEQDDDELVTP